MPTLWFESGAEHRADLAACRALLRGGSRSFWAASLLLPRSVREPASALYAFCRLGDDAIDEAPSGGTRSRLDALAKLRERLHRAYDGRPFPIAADRALARTVAQFAIPRALPEALLDGFAWDAQQRRYDDLPDLLAYAARVAGSVGAMMAVLMGVRAPAALARACDLGVAMQLSNIARDVGEDARAGRLYLPLAWLRQAGIDPDAFLAHPVFDARLAEIVGSLLDSAAALYARADGGIAALPLPCRPGIGAARLLYAAIGQQVARGGLDSVTARAVVAPGRKAALLAQSLLRIVPLHALDLAPPLAETQFLVEAVTQSPPPRPAPTTAAAGNSVVWLIDLFATLEQRELRQGE